MHIPVTARTLLVAVVASMAPVGASHADDTQATVPAAQVATTAPSMVSARVPAGEVPAGPDSQSAGAASTATAPASAAGYVPKTKYDNTPYRFNAGSKFSAAEFDAWMKSRGIRVAKGSPAADAPAAVPASESSASGSEAKAAPTNCATGAADTAC